MAAMIEPISSDGNHHVATIKSRGGVPTWHQHDTVLSTVKDGLEVLVVRRRSRDGHP